MKNVDEQYLDLLSDILQNGQPRHTRSGNVISVFDRSIKIDMKQGFPLLTTKKMFTKGSFHEILWMLKGDVNIKYLIEHNVHIWDGDAYRHYKELIKKHNSYLSSINRDAECLIIDDNATFLVKCMEDVELVLYPNKHYKYGDLGPVYGLQWRNFGNSGVDQIENIISTLRTNPEDRRLLCVAWNPADLTEMALPPCHYSFQLYTRLLSQEERDALGETHPYKINELPKYELSLKWTQRSCDFFLGVPFNISGYALLLSLIAHCVNMTVGTLSGSFGDCHIYEQHIQAVHTQLERDPNKYHLPTLKILTPSTDINDIKYEDLLIDDYKSYPKISAELSVG